MGHLEPNGVDSARKNGGGRSSGPCDESECELGHHCQRKVSVPSATAAKPSVRHQKPGHYCRAQFARLLNQEMDGGFPNVVFHTVYRSDVRSHVPQSPRLKSGAVLVAVT